MLLNCLPDSSSRLTILKEATEVDPGCVEIMPRKRVTPHVRTWLYSLHTDTRNFSDSLTPVIGERCTLKVWEMVRIKFYH